MRGIHKPQVNDSCRPGHPGDGQARGPKWIGRLGCATVAMGASGWPLWDSEGYWDEGSVDVHLFPVLGGSVHRKLGVSVEKGL